MSQEKTKILLTGYRATGKTTIGKEVARRLGFSFLDTDKEIERTTGKTISRIVSEKGWQHFRDLEQSLLVNLAERRDLVIAAGGGAVLNRDGWGKLRSSSLTVWLTASAATICSRLAGDRKSRNQRPSLTDRDILEEVEYVMNERLTLYEDGSDFKIDSEQDIQSVAGRIVAAWEEVQGTGYLPR